MLYTKTLCALSRATAFSFEVSSAEELSNRATLEIMIDKIRQQLRLLPYTYFLIIIAITIII